jgi:SAM-dependent methyltransferase
MSTAGPQLNIRTRQQQCCVLCGREGHVLYDNLIDRLYRAPGVWRFKFCGNIDCGLVWLDPKPLEQDVRLLYENYFTHHGKIIRSRSRKVHRLYQALLWATGLARQRDQLFSFYLTNARPGRLLEVGCGDGGQLDRLRSMNWETEGQEIDAAAVERARTRGLRVHLGNLQDLSLPAESFDVVTMSHVIEHAHDPVELLKQCHRVLRPGGLLIVVTPNVNSFGHWWFKSFWLGLDPPRHLNLFAPRTLRQIAHIAGFQQDCHAWTTPTNAQFLAEASWNIKRHGRHTIGTRPSLGLGIKSLLFQFFALAAHRIQRDSGEECVLRAVK